MMLQVIIGYTLSHPGVIWNVAKENYDEFTNGRSTIKLDRNNEITIIEGKNIDFIIQELEFFGAKWIIIEDNPNKKVFLNLI